MIANIQALRALAALLVVIVHLELLLAPVGIEPRHIMFGGGGVDLFFVISGFIMVYTTGQSWPSTGNFLLNRVIRIVPLYWLITLAVFAIALAAPSLLSSTEPRLDFLAKSLAFIPYVKANGAVEPILFLGWTLNYEMFFYLFLGIGLTWKGRGLVAVALFFVALVILGAILRASADFADPVARFYTAPILLEFVFGMGIGAAFLAPRHAAIWTRTPRLLAVAMVAGGMALLIGLPFAQPTLDRAIYTGIPAALVVTGVLMLERQGTIVRGRWVLLLGDASYAIYLTHPFVTQAMTKLADTSGLLTPAARLSLVPVAYAGVIVTGVAVHLMIEKPMSRWLRQAIHLRRKSAPAGGM
ncbi:acyltransferase [Croceicoccus sp. Ery5]|uniref:acyltransferase family protein n=1 Tax=Croceicoccus sp. Ery5 TaxID=1703340 RepID=UPI001E37C4CD|nr:acyltransferase [Croceicoccus sp. Ery5]